MKNFDSYYDPPEDDPCCEDGCGQTLIRDIDGEWFCDNKFCPLKFQGVEQEMAFALVDALDNFKTYKHREYMLKLKYDDLLEKFKDLEWKWNNTNK